MNNIEKSTSRIDMKKLMLMGLIQINDDEIPFGSKIETSDNNSISITVGQINS